MAVNILGVRPPLVDYESPATRAARRPLAVWQRAIAYAVIVAPAIYLARGPVPHPLPVDWVVWLYVLLGIAVGAGLFIVRRRPRDFVGWLGLIGWGTVVTLALVGEIRRRLL